MKTSNNSIFSKAQKLIDKRYRLLMSFSGFKDWFHATYVLFLVEKGLNQLQINSINTFFMFGNFIFEPISGFVQDKIGQIQIYWIGNLFWSLSFLTYFFGKTYWHFVAAELLGAVGMAAVVGSLESFLENKLGVLNAKNTKAKGRSLGRFFEMLPASLGSFIAARYGLGMPWIISSIFSFLVLIVSIVILKPLINIPDVKDESQNNQEIELSLKQVLKFVISQKRLLITSIIVLASKFVFQAYNMTWTRIFAEDIPEKYLGILWIGVSISILVGLWIARKLDNTIEIVLISLIGVAISMFVGSILGNVIITLVMFYLHEFVRAIFNETIETYAAQIIPNKIRSSTKSMLQTFSMFGAMGGLLVSGWLGDLYGLKQTWSIVSAFLFLFSLVTMIFVLLYKRKTNL